MYKSDTGYTIIEIIIAIQIFMIIVSLTYSIYLFGYKFISRWDDKTDIHLQEMVIQNILYKQIDNSKSIIEISPVGITAVNSDYKISKLLWSEDTLYINGISLNNNDQQINLSQTSFYVLGLEKIFTEVDLNRDGRLKGEELETIKGIKYKYRINSKNYSYESSIIKKLPDTSQILKP